MNLKLCAKCGLFKCLNEYGTLSKAKDKLNPWCKPCIRSYNAEYRDGNREKVRSISAKWRESNRDVARARTAAWMDAYPDRQRRAEIAYRANNPEKRKASCRAYRDANPEKERVYRKHYAAANLYKLAANAAKRRALKLRATPRWAGHSEIKLIYAEAMRITAETGIEHHVDHIVPLKNKLVCGLHCEANLRIIHGLENLTKGNRFWPDMP